MTQMALFFFGGMADTLKRDKAVQDKIRRMEADRDARVEAFRKSIPKK